MESGLSSEDVPVQQPSAFTSKRLFAVGAGLLGLAGCAATVLHASAPSRAGVQPAPLDTISARALLEHPDFIDTATENVQTLLGDHMHGKEHRLQPAIRHAMSKVTELLNEHDPEGSRQLEAIKLNQQQKTDVLSVVKRMSDKHVQQVGREVLQIAMKHQNDKEKAIDGIERDISSAFHPRLEELKTLKKTVMPASLRSHKGDASAASQEETVRQRRLSVCKGDTSQCKPGSEITDAMAKDTNMKVEDAGAIIAGLLEQARLALDESAVIGGAFGSKTRVPYYWRSAIAGLDYAAEVGDCLMRQNDKHIKDADGKMHTVDGKEANPVKSSMCMMKYAGAGMDFLSGLNNVAGVQNSRLHQDFKSMFGGANPQAAYNAAYNPAAQQQAAQMNPFAMLAPQPQPTAHPLAPMAQGVGAMMGQHAATVANTAAAHASNLANVAAAHAQNFADAAAQAHAAATAANAATTPAVGHN